MKEYKVLQSTFNWTQNITKFEDLLNTYARQGWTVKDIELIGGAGTNFIALLEKGTS